MKSSAGSGISRSVLFIACTTRQSSTALRIGLMFCSRSMLKASWSVIANAPPRVLGAYIVFGLVSTSRHAWSICNVGGLHT